MDALPTSFSTRKMRMAIGSQGLPSSALAIVSALRIAAPGSLEFTHRMDQGSAVRPSEELLALCSDQMRACERDFQHQLRLTAYLRSTECYGTSNLELRHISCRSPLSEELLLLFQPRDMKFTIQQVEVWLAKHGAIELRELKALVVPMAKELCLVGLLVAERMTSVIGEDLDEAEEFCVSRDTADLRKLAHNLALACVLDQRVALLQHASWQKSVKIDSLLEQARASMTTMRTLGKMLLPHLKKGELSRDVLQDMLVQADRTKEVLQDIQEVLYFAPGGKADATEEVAWARPEFLLKDGKYSSEAIVHSEMDKDEEVPMPPLALAPVMHLDAKSRSCDVEEVLAQLVKAGNGMAVQRNLKLQLTVDSRGLPLAASVDDAALRQAMSKLIDSAMQRTPPGGWIRVAASTAPGGGVLVLIEDNGPDMSYMVQAQALGPLATGLPLEASFASLKLARDILERSGVVLRITSPFLVGTRRGGVRVEVWIPSSEAAVIEED